MKVEEKWILLLKPTSAVKALLEVSADKIGTTPFAIAQVNLERFRENSSVYLLPDHIKSLADGVNFIQKNYRPILEYELGRYIVDKKYWPTQLDYKLFTLLFESNFFHKILSL